MGVDVLVVVVSVAGGDAVGLEAGTEVVPVEGIAVDSGIVIFIDGSAVEVELASPQP
jgi:hypothetical protein